MRGHPDIRSLLAACLLAMLSSHGASATGVEPAKDLRIDPAPCLAASLAQDHDRTVSVCGSDAYASGDSQRGRCAGLTYSTS